MSPLVLLALCYLATLQGSHAQCPEVTGYNVVRGQENGTIDVRWTPPTLLSGDSIQRYILEYTAASSSVLETRDIGSGDMAYRLSDLLNFTSYEVSLSLMCVMNGRGPAVSASATTVATAPTAQNSTLTVNVINEGGDFLLVNISWTPLPEDKWNAIPGGYKVFLFSHPNSNPSNVFTILYPDSSFLEILAPGHYGVTVRAVNDVDSTEILSEETTVPGDGANGSFVDYPYFYILIPGVLFVVVIAVIIIVIFKKLCERNKGSVGFVRDIDNVSTGNYSKGFGNAIPLRDLSPQSPNSMSLPSAMTSPASVQPQHHHQHHHQQLANRPLPLSPTTDPSLQLAEADFIPPVSAQSSMSRKLTHPGPLPMLEENVQHGNFVPISRTTTDPSMGSVFSPVSMASAPPTTTQQLGQQRGRSNTLPSPYEVPDHNTVGGVPDMGSRPGSAHPNIHQMSARGGSNIPPPPTHSPPPLSTDVVFTDGPQHAYHNQPPQPHQHSAGQTSLPRKLAGNNKRSFSTSAAQGRNVGGKGLTYMKSEGNIHESLSDEDGMRYGHHEADTIISSTSSGGGGGTGHHHSLDRRGGAQRQQARQAHPGMINGALANSDQLGNFAVMGEGGIPPMQSYKVPSHGPHDDRKRESMFSETSSEGTVEGASVPMTASGQGRRESLFSESSGEVPIANGHASGGPVGGPMAGAVKSKDKNSRKGSVFSETSTESSNNSRSPGWDYKSEGGGGNRRHRSKTPPERETFQEEVFLSYDKNGYV